MITRTPHFFRWLLISLVTTGGAACSGSSKLCTPRANQACTCDNGAAGSQTCAADGQSWGSCSCPCQPACQGKECGPDGCGGSCGGCDHPPADTCLDSNTLRSYDPTGLCGEGICTYPSSDRACGFGCQDGACLPDPCAALTCDNPPDRCHQILGTCLLTPDVHCVYTPLTDGAPCDDGVYCNGAETCQGGACVSGTPVDCSSLNDKCNTGVCDETQKACAAQQAQNGTACDDGIYCNGAETCLGGVCTPGTVVDCSALTDACNTGDCSEGLHSCVARAKQNGTPCPDSVYCNGTETCRNGVCQPGTTLDCTAQINLPCYSGTCDEAQKTCLKNPLPDGSACDDGDPCTIPDSCVSQVCLPGPDVCGQPTVILVYLDADNDLDSDGMVNFAQMQAAPLDNMPWLRVFVLLDRAPMAAWSDTRLYEVHTGRVTELDGPHLGLTVANHEELNMADPNTLHNFILDVKDIIGGPASYYLVVWDHGGGWYDRSAHRPHHPIKEVCYDQTSGDDYMTTKALHGAIQGQGLALVGFDACVMGMSEVAYEIRNDAGIMVGSEDDEPAAGWDYKGLLGNFCTAPPCLPERFGRVAADTYVAEPSADDTVTMAVMDLTRMGDLAAAANGMAAAFTALDAATWTTVCSEAEWFDQWGGGSPYADFYRLAESGKSHDAANAAAYDAVMNALQSQVILYERHLGGHPNAHGQSIYFPCRQQDSFDALYALATIQWAADTTWDEMLQAH